MNQTNYNFDTFYERWILSSAIIHSVGFCITLFLDNPLIWVLLSLGTFSVYLFKITRYLPVLPLLYGYANWISILRFLIIITAFSLYPFINDIQLFLAFLTAIALDGVDGFLARKFNHETKQGAILDMEIDALMALILACIHIVNLKIPFWIVIPAGFRYVYAWILFIYPLKNEKEFLPKIIRATIAVIFFLTLLVPFVMNTQLTYIIVTIAGILIMISFGVSYIMARIPSK